MRYFGGTIGISVLSLQLGSEGVTTIEQHLSVIPFYAAALIMVMLAAFLLPVSNKNGHSEKVPG
jgi:hypothetical protein